MQPDKKTRGGVRKGAGRKPHGDVPKMKVSYKLDVKVAEFIRNHELPASKLIEDAVIQTYIKPK